MSRVVAILDSTTGAFIDADGRVREGARYRKLAKRMLSLETPTTVLDYGGNGAASLEISNGGVQGEEISLAAKKVKVTGQLMVGGSTLDEIISAGGTDSNILGRVVGKDGEITANMIQDPSDADRQLLQIALDPSVTDSIAAAKGVAEDVLDGKFASKDDITDLSDGLSVSDNSTLADVRAVLKTLIERISALS